jgi:hypothetical protein
MKNLFNNNSDDESNGMYDGMNKHTKETIKFIKPLLNSINFDIVPIRGDRVWIKRNISEYRNWSKMMQRFLPEGSGLLTNIFYIPDPSYSFICQDFVIDEAKSKALKDKPRFNIPTDIWGKTSNDNRIPYMLGIFEALELYYFILTKDLRNYTLSKFSDQPSYNWHLTNRFKSGDRMSINAKAQVQMFQSVTLLETDLKYKLKIK